MFSGPQEVDRFNAILSEYNILYKDNRFLFTLDKTKKCLIAGENGAGKTRLLKAIEDFYREKSQQESDEIKLFPLYCTEFNAFLPDEDERKKEIPNDDISGGIIYHDKPQNDVFTMNRETIFSLLDEILSLRKEDRRRRILEDINTELKSFLNKTLEIAKINGSDELMITRNGGIGVKSVPLMQEWNLLSPGERIIIFLFLLLFYLERMKDSIKKQTVIILLDEPEIHLHPKVMLDIIVKKLSILFSDKEGLKGHLFIASHSVFLVPFFEFEEQIYMKNNSVSPKSSKLYTELYNDLIGLENKDNHTAPNLFDFLGSVYDWNYAAYIAQCFMEPVQVDEIDGEDAQLAFLLRNAIYPKIKDKNNVAVLDYGCGKVARIGRCLAEKIRTDGNADHLKNHLRYFAYDAYGIDDNAVNTENIPCLAQKIKTFSELKTTKETFDIILLFNVLHEMDVLEWEEQINVLIDLLKNDGFLVFSERIILSRGEKPYGKSGYLIFSIKEFQKMFAPSSIERVSSDKDPVITVLVKKGQGLQKITTDGIIMALEELERNTNEKINSTLKQKENLSARNYAFYCQQYFNAVHAIELLKKRLQINIDDWNYSRIMDIEDIENKLFLLRKKAKGTGSDADKCRRELENWEHELKMRDKGIEMWKEGSL